MTKRPPFHLRDLKNQICQKDSRSDGIDEILRETEELGRVDTCNHYSQEEGISQIWWDN